MWPANQAMLTKSHADTGANASAEGGDDEATEDQAVKVNNIVHSFRLQSTSFDKKGYLAYLKGMFMDRKEHSILFAQWLVPQNAWSLTMHCLY